MYFVKQIAGQIMSPLTHLLTISIATGVIPNQMKIAKIIPVYKSGNSAEMNNYRPISLLSSFSKILEKIVAIRLTDFLDENKLLSPNQYGFRKKHSTVHAMTNLLNYVSGALNEKKIAVLIFCDLRKAFDTCNFDILLKKLFDLGIRDTELKWFENYLKNRQQFVYLNGVASSLLEILNGVPQGSILGPLLFLIYINDSCEYSNLMSILFADDTALGASGENLQQLNHYVNVEFHKICSYFRKNKLSLHPDKTKFIVFSNSNLVANQDFKIFISNSNLCFNDPTAYKTEIARVRKEDEVPAIKYLGVHFDPLLNFNYHTKILSKKVSKALYAIRAVKNFLPPSALYSIYYALFHSHINYAIQIWSSGNPANLETLFKIQKKAIRLISNSSYNAHTEPTFKLLEILPIKNLANFTKIQFMQQFVQKTLPSSLLNTWTRNFERRHQEEAQHHHHLRNDNDLFIPPARTNQIQRFPLFLFPELWNSVPDNIKILRNHQTFASTLKKHFISELSDIPRCDRLLCPSCHKFS